MEQKKTQIKEIKNINIPKYRLIKLNNGIPLYILNIGEQEITKIELLFNSGMANTEKRLTSSFTLSMLSEGTVNQSSKQLAENLDFYGAFTDFEIDNDFTSYSLFSLNKHLKNTAPIFEDIIKNPKFDKNDLEIQVNRAKQRFLIEQEKVKVVAKREFLKNIYGKNNPYSSYFEPTDFEEVKSNLLSEFHKNNYCANNCKIILAGKITDAEINLVEKHFGQNDWLNNNFNKLDFYKSSNSRAVREFIDKENAVQSAINIGKETIKKTDSDYIALNIVNIILGGYFGSRLMSNIREDKGYTYGIYSLIVPMKNSSYFFVATEVGSNVALSAVKEIYKEIKILKENEVPQDEFEVVRNYTMGNILQNFDGPLATAQSIKELIKYDFDEQYYYNYINKLWTINKQEIMEIANKYLNEDEMIEVIVGKKV